MSYDLTLEAAGAKVLAFKQFGSYQGTWLAFVDYSGKKGIVEGAYGSCSGCDAFEAEFGWNDREIEKAEDGFYYRDNNYWDEEARITEEQAVELNKQYQEKLKDFGTGYLLDIQQKDILQTRLDVINSKEEDDWFSDEEKEYLEWAISQFEINHEQL